MICWGKMLESDPRSSNGLMRAMQARQTGDEGAWGPFHELRELSHDALVDVSVWSL